MVTLAEIEEFLNRLLAKEGINDYTPNGVQVRGSVNVDRVVSGVSANLALFETAAQMGAQVVLTHHGLFWDKEPRVIEGSLKKRLKFLLDRDISLISYHLPLDRHPEFGNNAQILAKLALTPGEPFGHYRGIALSRLGRWSSPKSWTEVITLVQQMFGGHPLTWHFGQKHLSKVAVCSGGAPELAREALAAGADLFLVGEASESLFHFSQEEQLNVIVAGHHRTEKFGVMAIGTILAEQLGIHHQFIDIDNPI